MASYSPLGRMVQVSERAPCSISLKFYRVDPESGSTLRLLYRDFQSNCWVNLRILGQPCEFYLISAVGKADRHHGLCIMTLRTARRAAPHQALRRAGVAVVHRGPRSAFEPCNHQILYRAPLAALLVLASVRFAAPRCGPPRCAAPRRQLRSLGWQRPDLAAKLL